MKLTTNKETHMQVKANRDSENKGLRKGRISVSEGTELIYRRRFFLFLTTKKRLARLKKHALKLALKLVA
jgi:hypothetical protein